MRVALPFALFVAWSCASAAAQGSDAARARAHFEAGTQAFEEGDYGLAIREFRASYEITEHPDLLFNIYSAAERAGMLEDAAEALASYLDLGRPGRQRRSLTRRLERLRARIAEERERATPVEVTAPPEPLASAPEPAPPSEEAAAPDAEPVPETEATRPAGVHPAALVTLIGAGVLLTSFGAFAILSEVEDQALATRCGRDAGAQCTASDVQTLESLNLVADVSWISGAVAAATGVALWFLLPPEEGMALTVAPWASPHAAGATAVGRW